MRIVQYAAGALRGAHAGHESKRGKLSLPLARGCGKALPRKIKGPSEQGTGRADQRATCQQHEGSNMERLRRNIYLAPECWACANDEDHTRNQTGKDPALKEFK